MLKSAELRITVLAALAWRAMAEIARHEHPTHTLACEQFHPGISPRGVLQLELRPLAGRGSSVRFDFDLGGPEPGAYRVKSGGEEASGDFLQLLGDDPPAVIARMLVEAGLPGAADPLLSSSDRVLAMRLVAGLLERKVFSARAWRSTCAAYSTHDGYSVADWHRLILESEIRVGAWGALDEAGARRLSDLVLVHPLHDGDEAPVHDAGSLVGSGVVLDLESGAYGLLTSQGWHPAGDVRALYKCCGGAMRKMVDHLDSLIED